MIERKSAVATGRRRGTASPAAKAAPPGKRRRLDPADREREILDGAVAFFAEVGFDGGLRDLAKRLGITHQNLFRYFPTKEALIERVYKEVYLGRWQPEWETILRDQSRPLDQRLTEFYTAYLAAIFRYDFIRIFVFSGLRGVGISQRYFVLIQKKVVEPVGLELRKAAGLPVEPAHALSPAELEIAWGLHAELVYVAFRRWVFDLKTPNDLGALVRSAVAGYLEGAPAAMRKLAAANPGH